MRRVFIASIAVALLTLTGSIAVPAVSPASATVPYWVDARASVTSNPATGVEMTAGANSRHALVAVSGYRHYQSGSTFFTHRGTSYSRALCLSGGQVYAGSETITSTAVSGTGVHEVSTFTVEATQSSCRPHETLVGVEGKFGWGAPGDRFAHNYFTLSVLLPAHPSYASTVSPTEIEVLPDLSAGSKYLESLEAQLSEGRTVAEACARLGEKARTHSLRSSVPDAVLVCNASGLAAAIRLLMLTGGLLEAVTTADDAVNDPTFDPFGTDHSCDQVDSVGTCLAEGDWDTDFPDPEPEPEPAPAGSGLPPPPNCLDNTSRADLLNSMSNQNHHMATHFGAWGSLFQSIASSYGLSVVDSAHAWNVHSVPQSGGHPWNYHNWVYQNMELADEAAQAYPTAQQQDAFLSRFNSWVTQVVLADPTILRAGYWKCYEDYRWR